MTSTTHPAPHRSLPGWQLTVDVAVTAAALAMTLAQLTHGGALASAPPPELGLPGVLLALGATLPLLVWRRSPPAVFVATGSASVALAAFGYPVDLALGPAAALYLLAAGRGRTDPWTGRTTAVAVGLFVAYLLAAGLAHRGFPSGELLHTGLVATGAWFAGERTRLRRDELAALHDRARAAERDAERERLLAVAEERARIARDLHDSAGHAISLITVRAGAARLRADPDRAHAALATIEELARRTVEEIDRLVGSLRDDDGRTRTPTGLASIDTLIAQHTATGHEIVVERTGPPRDLDRATDQAAYRILQEALTNATRHGHGTVRVDLDYGDTTLDIVVSNPVGASTRGRGGHGLIGMRERAVLVGGRLDATPTGGRFEVRAALPYQAARP
jgi:signal transduction histidine kinase